MTERKKDYLIFVDTNIYLDFYRSQFGAELSLLDGLIKVKDSIISTEQVEMEFKKNRQAVILDSLREIKEPDIISFPALALGRDDFKATNKMNKGFRKRVQKSKDCLAKIMLEPKPCDKVYKACQEIFEFRSNLNLRCSDKHYDEIYHLAEKRFMLGYPPRKNDYITIGDSINWEWIITCCSREKKDVVIVSRDGDYGITFNNKSIVKNWLNEEFKSRTSPRRKAILTNKLSEGLKKLSVSVSKEAEDAEANLSARVNLLGSSAPFVVGTTATAGSIAFGTSPYAIVSPASFPKCSICGRSMSLLEAASPSGGFIEVCNKCRSVSK